MISKIISITVNGLSSNLIDVEVDINNGLPNFTIVGLPDQSVQESKERIRSALKSSSFKLPQNKITVNLAPSNIRKSGSSFDLPIAIGILLQDSTITKDELVKESCFVGELSLDGALREIEGVLPMTIGARENGLKRIFLPYANALEASIVPDIEIIPVHNLAQLVDILNTRKDLPVCEKIDFAKLKTNLNTNKKYDFVHIIGQFQARRALEIAAAGGHNIIMQGPPGSGKTMLAKSLATILPDLTIEESIEISKIYSISGLLSKDNPIIVNRPFRTIHHTASAVSIIGGGRNARPGEISLAHKGILFLDEILEFQKSTLEVLRQPMEDHNITVTRVNSSFTYPARFSLVGAMNPCPCGYLGSPDKKCICSPLQIKNYKSRLSGPLIDRVDLFIDVPKVDTKDFANKESKKTDTSADIKKRVEKARDLQLSRFAGTHITFNSEMDSEMIKKYCVLDDASRTILEQAIDKFNLSARSYTRILKLSRTIADLDDSVDILAKHLLEALSYRKKEED